MQRDLENAVGEDSAFSRGTQPLPTYGLQVSGQGGLIASPLISCQCFASIEPDWIPENKEAGLIHP